MQIDLARVRAWLVNGKLSGVLGGVSLFKIQRSSIQLDGRTCATARSSRVVGSICSFSKFFWQILLQIGCHVNEMTFNKSTLMIEISKQLELPIFSTKASQPLVSSRVHHSCTSISGPPAMPSHASEQEVIMTDFELMESCRTLAFGCAKVLCR